MTSKGSAEDPYLNNKVDSLADSPMQNKLRALCPVPIGVVVWQRIGDGLPELRSEFKTIRRLGFASLKQIMLTAEPAVQQHDAELAALDEGITPWHYGIGGWQEITPDLLRSLGIPEDLSMDAIQQHPKMLRYQKDVLAERARRLKDKPASPPDLRLGEPSRQHGAVADQAIPAFAAWLRENYDTLEHALTAYQIRGESAPKSFEELAALSSQSRMGRGAGWIGFRQKRDVLRFHADAMCERIRREADRSRAWDPNEPIRTGIHQVLENQAASGWDFELQARAVSSSGSFYGSFHPTHHLAPVDGELDRPCYMSARIVADANKGGWSAMWESVGGPQTWSGHFSYTIDGPTLERCLLTYLAAGLKGAGIWCWNPRDRGWEIGEYGLCDLQGRPTDRAHMAAAVARACHKYRFELWQARDEPEVGILSSWENEAAFARMSYGGYPTDRLSRHAQQPVQARIGAMRSLIDGGIGFELVTDRNLKEGLASRYQTIYMPHTICLDAEVLSALTEYVESGGRLVADSPSLLIRAEDGTLFNTAKGSEFERLFGLEIRDLQSTFNRPLHLEGLPITGLYSDIRPTKGTIAKRFDSGQAAVLEHRHGRGSTAFLAFEAASMCSRPGNQSMQDIIMTTLLAGRQPKIQRDRPILTYRRATADADHLFCINDTPSHQRVRVGVRGIPYRQARDCVTDAPIPLNDDQADIALEPWRGKWLRLERA